MELFVLRIENKVGHQDGIIFTVVCKALSMDLICCCVDIGGGNPENVATLSKQLANVYLKILQHLRSPHIKAAQPSLRLIRHVYITLSNKAKTWPSIRVSTRAQGTMTMQLGCSVDRKTNIVPSWVIEVMRLRHWPQAKEK